MVTASLTLDGEELYAPGVDVVALRQRVGMVFQRWNPFPKSIYDNVAYGPRINGGLTRAALDERLGLTPDEFRVEGSLVAVGPIVGENALVDVVAELEGLGLVYYDDFFELSGNWPEWLRVFVRAG